MLDAPSIQVYNTLGRVKQDFHPREAGKVSMYSCGPTVYKYAHLGNFRTYLMSDFWVRALEYLGHDVTQVQNITDVGHLVNDEEDTGEDKILASALEEGKTPEEIADFYTAAFTADAELLRIKPPAHQPRATDFIPEMIGVIQELEALGLTYTVNGNVFYDVVKRGDYPKLSGNTLEQLQAGARIEVDPNKRHPADFLLWKAGGERRLQIWDSPWGRGFPGWHIECTAMSMHYFPRGFDIHTGGIDNIFPHHEDEIAQSDAVAGHQVVNYWIHGAFLQMDGLKMAKSAGRTIRVTDLIDLGHDPLAFRFLYLGARYRAKLSFSLEALEGAERGLASIRQRVSRLGPATAIESEAARLLEARFRAALADDLDLPLVSVLLQEVLRSPISEGERRGLLERWDGVLQLDLARDPVVEASAPPEALELAARRETARRAGDWAEADRIRDQLDALGWTVEDSAGGSRLKAVHRR